MGLLVEKTFHGVKIHWLSSKGKVPGAAVSKEGYADSLLGHERNHLYWSPGGRGDATLNIASYC